MAVNSLGGGGVPVDLARLIAEELATLAADAQTLQTRLVAGDVIVAVVLPSNGLSDVIDIGGLRVAAELPPALLPGETITVEVTGFSGDRINLHVLPPTGAVSAPPRPAAAPPAPAVAAGPFAQPARSLPLAAARAARSAPEGLGNVEARLATARATAAPLLPPPTAASKTPAAHLPPPVIAPRVADPPPAAAATAAAVATPRIPAAFIEPATLLRGLELPVSPSNVALTRLVLESPLGLPHALETLARVLSATTGPQTDTLRTLVGFLERLEPGSPVLATQVAAFVDQVVIGREGKLAQLLVAHAQASALAEPAPPNHDAAEAQLSPAGPQDGADPSLPLAAGRVAIREAALDYDLKTRLLAVLKAAPEAGAAMPKSQALAAALTGVLSAVTALQAGAAATLAAHPDGLAFVLPIALPTGFVRARVRIDRDAPQGKNVAPDGANFHVAFILETPHLGTVAIDLVTVGRSVTLGVKTEAVLAQQLFGGALSRLTQRLEALRYRVVRADAVVAPRGPAPQPEAASGVPADCTRLVDLDA